jgi:hypothetical protein
VLRFRLRLPLTALFALVAPLLAGPSVRAAAPLAAPAHFDFAPAGTGARTGSWVLAPDATGPTPATPGSPRWLAAPATAFALDAHWGLIRAPALLDGVGGPACALQLDLAPGRWAALVFLDDGHRDAHTIRVRIDARDTPHNPRAFGLEEEPGPPPINRYRVAHFVFQASAGTPVTFSFAHPVPAAAPHGVRLLALQLLPLPDPTTDRTRWLHRLLVAAGRHDSRASLDGLHVELGTAAEDPAARHFGAYWQAQLALLAEAERWHAAGGWDHVNARTRSSMFTRYKQALALLDPLVEHPDGDAFPLRPRALWLRTRLLYWIWLEQKLPPDDSALARDLAAMRRLAPADPLVAMYAGEQVPDRDAPTLSPPLPGAPAWSVAQLEALQRLRHVAHHWIDRRQAPNGELGGKPDDDVETLRWWPVLMFSGDRKVLDGFARLADGVWFSRHLHLGFSREPRDVEHSSEFVADTAPLLAWFTRTPEAIDRLAWSHRHFRDLWTGRNTHGDLHFQSAWIGSTSILSEPPRNRDVALNTRAVKAVRYLAALRPADGATPLLHAWSRAWAAAAARTDKGKPAGLFPASVRWPDATFNADEPSWHRANMFWRYFDWRGDGMLYDQLLQAWTLTGDDSLLAPLRTTLDLLAAWTDPAARAAAPEGSAGWAAARLFERPDFWGVVAQWRFETGDASRDAFLLRHGPPYLRVRLGADAAALVDGLTRTLLEPLRFNTPLRTTEVLFTDRIHVSRDEGNVDGIDLLLAMLTGQHVTEAASPYYRVIWEDAPGTFTALVSDTGPRTFVADLFLHQAGPSPLSPRLLRLPPGRYRLTLRASERTLLDREETVTGPDHRVHLELPGGTPVQLSVR